MLKRWISGFFASVGMYSIFPTPKIEWNDATAPLLIPCFPLVGLLIGGVWYAAAWIVLPFSIPNSLKAVVLALLPMVLSGFLHVDGYMDTSDAILSRRPLEEKRRILKDSHVGAFGVIMLSVCLLILYASASAAAEWESPSALLIWIPVLSRCICGILVVTVRPMSETGYVVYYQQHLKPVHRIWMLFLALAGWGSGWWMCGFQAVWVLGVLTVSGLLTAWTVCSQLGGISGDLSGCVLTVAETCALATLAIVG